MVVKQLPPSVSAHCQQCISALQQVLHEDKMSTDDRMAFVNDDNVKHQDARQTATWTRPASQMNMLLWEGFLTSHALSGMTSSDPEINKINC